MMFCSSKMTGMPRPRSSRVKLRVSTVLRAKRETDLARIMSIFPCLHWRIIRRNSFRLQVEVPVMPSSANTPAIVQPGSFMIFSV